MFIPFYLLITVWVGLHWLMFHWTGFAAEGKGALKDKRHHLLKQSQVSFHKCLVPCAKNLIFHKRFPVWKAVYVFFPFFEDSLATWGEMLYATGGWLGNPNHWFPGPGLSYLSKYAIAGYNFEPPEANGLCPTSPVYPKQPNRPAYSTQPANRPINILC